MYIHLYHNKTQKTKALTCWFGYGNVLTHHYVKRSLTKLSKRKFNSISWFFSPKIMLPYDIDYVMSQWGRGKFLLETLLECEYIFLMILQFCTKYIMLQTTLIYIHKSFKEKFFFFGGGKGEIMPHHINMWLWSRDCIMYFQYNKKSICICKIMCSFPIHKGTISFLFSFFLKIFFTVTLLLNTMKAFQNDAKFVTYRKDSKF